MRQFKGKALIYCCIIAICLLYAIWSNNPFSATDELLSKQEASRQAFTYLHLQEKNSEYAVTYGVDKETIAYLQKYDLLDAYYEQYDAAYPLDYYRVEIMEGSGQRYEAFVHRYNGTVAGWHKQIDAARQTNQDTALHTAMQYLQNQFPQMDSLANVETRDVQINGQTAYDFYFKNDAITVGEATLTSLVRVQGEEVTAYRSIFTPPEPFMQWLSDQDERSGFLTGLNFWITVGFAAAALVCAVIYRRYLQLKDGLVLLGIYIFIEVLQYINLLPTYESMITYRHAPWPVAVISMFMTAVITAVFALAIYFPYIAGRAMALHRQPHGQQMILFGSPLSWSSGMKAAVKRGYLLAIPILALQALMYDVAAANFHVWWIPDPSLSLDNMIWPILTPLNAWAAAIGEEIVYRLFAILLFKKLFRSNFVAILLSAMIWGLGHTTYPVYPVYTRFIEVTVIGIIMGYIFLKFGFITVLFTHAVLDSILMGLDVLPLGGSGFIIAGLVYMASPAIVGLLLGKFRKSGPADPPDGSLSDDLSAGPPTGFPDSLLHPPRRR